jgi:heterodisulfide reductase subunit A
VVDVPAVRDYAATLPHVAYVSDNLYSCSQDTQDAIIQVIRDNRLNRIVLAACTPKTHEPLFQDTLSRAGLNKYLFEMTNVRNQDSWVHKDDPRHATEKAMDLVRMAVAKVALMEPLEEAELDIHPRVLVVGGGVAGMSAAASLSRQGYPVTLVERREVLGGQALHLFQTWKREDVPSHLSDLTHSVESDPNVDVHLQTELSGVEGFVGNFSTTLRTNGTETAVKHGATVIATGAYESEPEEYLYGANPRVLTHLELDRRLRDQDPSLRDVSTAAFIQCVGSREPQRPYCSRVCCTHSVESALHLKELNPEMNVYILYRDMRTYGEREYLYQKAREAGVIFIRYSVDRKPEVSQVSGRLQISIWDPVLQATVAIPTDLVVLAAAIVPYGDEQLAKFFKIPLNEDGFFVEAHAKLGPSEFATDGVFLCGNAHYPKSLDEAVAQGQAAASRAVTLLAQKHIAASGMVAQVNTLYCTSCGVCVEICPYGAPAFRKDSPFPGKAEINPVLCKGCGLCVASCRSGAVNLKGFGTDQILAMINEV